MSNEQGFCPPLGWKWHLLCFPTAPRVTWVDAAENLLPLKEERETQQRQAFIWLTRQIRKEPESIHICTRELYARHIGTYRRRSYFTGIYTLRKCMKRILFKHSWSTNIPRQLGGEKPSFVPPESLAHLSLGASKPCINPPPKRMLRFICSEEVIFFWGGGAQKNYRFGSKAWTVWPDAVTVCLSAASHAPSWPPPAGSPVEKPSP